MYLSLSTHPEIVHDRVRLGRDDISVASLLTRMADSKHMEQLPLQRGREASIGTATTKFKPPISILFVCLGNICRSPMAEAVFRSLTSSNSRVVNIDSAGTGAYQEGDPPDPRTMSTLKDNGITDFDHAARKIQASDFSAFNYILAMDKDNLYDLQRLKSRIAKSTGTTDPETGKVMLFGDFGGKKGEQVGDPYYGARNGFAIAYEQMVRFSKGFIAQALDKVEHVHNEPAYTLT